MRSFLLTTVWILCTAAGAFAQTAGAGSFTFVLLHNNDGESSLGNIDHFASVLGTERAAADAAGLPSVFVSSGDNMLAGAILGLWLDESAQPTGTPYDAIALSMLDYDALAIGNHEFDFGPDALAAFISSFTASQPPFLSCNLSFENVPSLQALVDAGRILPSTVLERNGEQIGIIGAITPELIGITSPGATTINPDIVSAIQAQVTALEAAGVNKIVLISHLQSITNDIELAALLSGIDIVVAGGGDNYLTNDAGYNGPHPVFGPYPYQVTDASGATVHIVTTVGNYTHLGALTVTFDANGLVTNTHPEVSGIRQVDLGPTAPSDAAVYAAVVQPVQQELAELAANGATCVTQIDLDVRKPSVRSRANGIGNIVADAYLKAGRDLATADPTIPMPVLGIANGGGIRCNGYGSSQGCIYPAGYTLTEVDMNDILPFANFIAVLPSVTSEQLKLVFENAVSKITLNPLTGAISGDDGRFAQISGGTLVYDITAAPYENNPADCSTQFAGLRVQSFVLDNGLVIIENGVPVPGVSIPVATVDFTAGLGGPEGFGGDCYPWGTEVFVGSTVRAADAFIDYLTLDLAGTVTDVAYQAYPPVTTGRIQVLLPEACADATACNFGATAACLFADVCGVCGGNGSTCAPGCTDATACNYDANAVADDGSCVFGSAASPCTVSFQVAYSEDDAEESLNPASQFYGTPYIDSSDLELTEDGADNQAVGIRFRNVNIPAGATIATAYVQFTVDALHSGPTSVSISLEDAASPEPFSPSVPFGISSRPTWGSVVWPSIPAWTVVGEAGAAQATPDLSELVEHAVQRDDWSAGNALAFVLTGSGRREAEAFDGVPSAAPVLHVSYYLEEEPQPCVLGVVYVSEAHTSGEPKDYIELYNSGSADCWLTGFQLDDATVLQDLTFGEVLLAAGGYWIGYEDAPGSFTSGLSSGGDLVVLGDGQGNSLVVTLGPSIGTQSQSFNAAGVGCYTVPTPGAANAACGNAGCMDATACNYDATATTSDNSCVYSDGVLNCDGTCINDADADGICDENEGIAGCTDASAENYDPQATDDDGSCWVSDLAFEVMGTHATGQFDAGAAEIVDYHAGTQRLFYVNASARTVDCLDMSAPESLPLLFTIDATAYGASANSLVVFGDYVAVAIEGNGVDVAGQVVIFDVNGNFVSAAPAGFLPDAVTVSHDGTTLVVSNEGQPNESYTVDPVGSVTLVDVTNPAAPVATQVGFTGITSDMLDASVRIFGPGASIAQDLEPEYSAFSADDSQVYVSCQENNCVIVVDVAAASVVDVWGLGFKDHMLAGNGLDASNVDGAINIQNWPVKGLYLPDAIHSYESNGTTYLVMANEGDTRAYSGYSEERRVSQLQLDPTAFPNAATLKLNANLGRLLVTRSKGDTDGDGDYDELYSIGGRSFSIYTTDGTQVYDSGDDFEQITATLFPADFNSTNSGNASFDNRSDDKGPEPEGVEIGEINGRMYAFVGLERMSGVMVYDITDPLMPVYQRYLSNRDFSVASSALQTNAAAAGDLGPEGLVFVHATDSPDGQPYLVTSNEISGTVTAYALTSSVIPPVTPACQLGVVYVSEAHTSGVPKDYIELYNSGSTDCSLEGFKLDDSPALNDLTFGDVVLEAGAYWIGYEDAAASFTSGLSSSGDIVVLADPSGASVTVVLEPSLAHYGQSFNAEGEGCYAEPTPGAANAACEATQVVTVDDLGCTYPTACNYDADALFDNGTCDFTSCVGCTYAGACNFDASATIDDGSCEFLEGDFDDNGYITISDLLQFLAVYQSSCN
jgi:2',3'-cyclic-nucleotide 2'-phosphodiesterase (5'-nucleotidase family)